jgi:hypothetical protein
MNDDLQRAVEKRSRKLAGPTPIEQHIILLKLTELIDSSPDLSVRPNLGTSPQRQWIAEIGALVCRISTEKNSTFNVIKGLLDTYWEHTVRQIHGLALDVIEELKLDLELSGKADVGSAYAPGDVYKFFADLKSLINGAKEEIFLIDPYFDGEAFDNYFSSVSSNIRVRIFANKHAQEVKAYIEKHKAQFDSKIEIRKNKNLHDRLVIIDNGDCWITGGSVNHAGNKSPSYLIPVGTEIANDKLSIYNNIWCDS